MLQTMTEKVYARYPTLYIPVINYTDFGFVDFIKTTKLTLSQ